MEPEAWLGRLLASRRGAARDLCRLVACADTMVCNCGPACSCKDGSCGCGTGSCGCSPDTCPAKKEAVFYQKLFTGACVAAAVAATMAIVYLRK